MNIFLQIYTVQRLNLEIVSIIYVFTFDIFYIQVYEEFTEKYLHIE